MAGKNCPVCRLINPESAERCDCGYKFSPLTDPIASKASRQFGLLTLLFGIPAAILGVLLLLSDRFNDLPFGDTLVLILTGGGITAAGLGLKALFPRNQ
jgi:hypothetical protein